MCGSDIFLGLIAVLFPPLAVWVKKGICSADSLINIALCCLGFLPGLLHAWYIIASNPDPTYEELQDAEQGRVTYYYVQTPQPRSYGAVNSTPDSQFPASAHPQPQQQPGPSEEVPPSYQQAVRGDNKIQGP